MSINDVMDFLQKYGGQQKGQDISDEAKIYRDDLGEKIKPMAKNKGLELAKKPLTNSFGTAIRNMWWYQFYYTGHQYSPISISVFVEKMKDENTARIRVKVELDNKLTNPYYDTLYERQKKEEAMECIIQKDDQKKDKDYLGEIEEAINQFITMYEGFAMKETKLKKTIGDAFKEKKQIILTGAPGTGKTHTAREYAREMVGAMDDDEKAKKRVRFVQFHPSFDYTDFIEGLRPVKVSETEEKYEFVRVDGIFKSFCRQIERDNKVKKAVCEILNSNIGEQDKNIIIKETDKILGAEKYKFKEWEKLPEEVKKIIKSVFGVEEGELSKLPDEIKKDLYEGINNKSFEKDTFLEFEPYFFIIDEINRADLSKVFGELMYGLEESYRAKKPYPQSQYSYLPTYEVGEDGIGSIITYDVYKEGFYIPENLYIIGTMNDIDRSVESFDFALRRRFKWIDVTAELVMEDVLKSIINKKIQEIDNTKEANPWKELLENKDGKFNEMVSNINGMNQHISGEEGQKLMLSSAYHIGPAYFKALKLKDGEPDFKTVFKEYIEPILREYTRGIKSKEVDVFIVDCKTKLIRSGAANVAADGTQKVDGDSEDNGSLQDEE